MTTETKLENTTATAETSTTENQTASNKAVFGPLGKYAIVAVIMVSVIVTTAIMLNKELGTVEGKIASIEDEVSELAAADATTSESINTDTIISAKVSEDNVAATTAETTPVIISSAETTVSSESTKAAVFAVTSREVIVADTAPTAKTESTTYESMIQARHAQLASQKQDRIDAHKLEQKQRMTEMFARIKTLEAKQLDQYKSHQDTQVERLREQIAIQQKMIDTLISRNKELYDLRAANVQEHQTKREAIINRI
jgi:hypothetical protein